MERFLTAKELSELLNVRPATIYLWTHTEFIPHYKLGKSVRFCLHDVEEWLEKRKFKGRKGIKYDTISP